MQIIFQNNLDQLDDVHIESDDVLLSIYEHFEGTLPDNVRIYEGNVSEELDITPGATSIEDDIEYLNKSEGPIYVVNHPQFFLFGLGGIFGSLLKVLLLGLLSYLLRPKPPKERNVGDDSPNNGLSERVNTARPRERIPDIYGQVNSVPDLIMLPYTKFIDHREVEFAYMCFGRGEFTIADIKDGVTPIEDISSLSYEIYGPNTSPNSGTPVATLGTAIAERVWAATKSNAVNGQVLRAPNASSIQGDADISFVSTDQIVTNNQDLNFEEYFAPGDDLTIVDAMTQGETEDLDGTYEILSVTSSSITLVNPIPVNANWTGPFTTGYTDAKLSTDTDKWIGPFVIKGAYRVLLNYIATNGLYSDDGEEQFSMGVNLEAEFQMLDSTGTPTGTIYTTVTNVQGSAELKNARMNSGNFFLPGQTIAESKKNSWQVRVRRTTETPDFADRQVSDEIQWRDFFGLGYVEKTDFGDVTTIQTKTPATAGALSVKERKLNALVTRKITGTSTVLPNGGAPWYFTNSPVNVISGGLIIRAIALDDRIGKMAESELDYPSIFSAVAEVQNYFGTIECRNFGYTFDDKNMSAEEMIQIVSNAMFCNAYRQGEQLKLNFEKKTDLSLLQFNHRNKIPGSEIRTVRFGNHDDHDGVDFDWVDQTDGAVQTIEVNFGTAAENPKKLELPGVNNLIQAHMHAYRELNKIKYRNVAIEFEATAEAASLVLGDRILVADNTRGDTFDGNIISQDGTTLGLSQEFAIDGIETYTIFLQHWNGSVEALPVLSAPDNRSVTLGTAPSYSLVMDSDKYARTTYIISRDSGARALAFLTEELDPKDPYVVGVSATNYDERFYDNDEDFIDGVFDDNVTTQTIIFRETWESESVPAGEYRQIDNPGQFTSTGPIEVQNNPSGIGPAAEGTNHVELDGTLEIEVTITTDTSDEYDLIMYYSPRPGVSQANNEIEVWWDGSLFMSLETDGTSNTTTVWENIFEALPTPSTSSTVLKFLSVTDGGFGLGGLIDDIRIQENSSSPPVVGTGEIGWWCPSLDDAGNELAISLGGASVYDISEASNPGTLTNMDPATDWVADTDSGGVRAIEMDGTNDIIKMGDVLDQGSGDFSVQIWIKASATLTTATAGVRLIQKRGTGSVPSVAGWSIGVKRVSTKVNIVNTVWEDGTNSHYIHSTGADEAIFEIGDTDAWIHLVVLFDNTNNTWKFYADDVLVGNFTVSSSIASVSNARELTIGAADVTESEYYEGFWDDARIWNRILTTAEITARFAGRGS